LLLPATPFPIITRSPSPPSFRRRTPALARGAISHGRRSEGRSAAGAAKLLVRLVRVAGWRAKLKARAACVCRDGYRFAKRNGKPAFHECEKPATDRHFRDLPAERAPSRSDSVHRDT